ncbi:hypothetical protein D9M73_254680 [compost metagenome]
MVVVKDPPLFSVSDVMLCNSPGVREKRNGLVIALLLVWVLPISDNYRLVMSIDILNFNAANFFLPHR